MVFLRRLKEEASRLLQEKGQQGQLDGFTEITALSRTRLHLERLPGPRWTFLRSASLSTYSLTSSYFLKNLVTRLEGIRMSSRAIAQAFVYTFESRKWYKSVIDVVSILKTIIYTYYKYITLNHKHIQAYIYPI